MASAGRILIIPKGEYNPKATYDMLDLVSCDGAAWIAKKEVKGIKPSEINDEYWHLFVRLIGKSAYEYAKDGGYTGTEEELASKLAEQNPTIFDLYICTDGEYADDGTPTIEPEKDTVYLVPNSEESNVYTEWSYTDNGWEKGDVVTVSLEEDEADVESSVKESLTNGKLSWSEEETQKARDLLGVTALFDSIINGNEVAY